MAKLNRGVTDSRTPIADSIRKLELQLVQMRSDMEHAEALHSVVSEGEDMRYPVVHPALHSNYHLNKNNYLALLQDHIDLLRLDIQELETKLTTVYAAINDCLED